MEGSKIDMSGSHRNRKQSLQLLSVYRIDKDASLTQSHLYAQRQACFLRPLSTSTDSYHHTSL
jgi:hypothetical protein